MRALALLALVACHRREPITTCDQDLRGLYAVDGKRWNIIEGLEGYEIYPLFEDVPIASGFELGPRVIDIGDGLTGHVHRWYMRGAARCTSSVPVAITRCADDTLELVVTDPVPPLAFSPCQWPHPEPSHVERWRRE